MRRSVSPHGADKAFCVRGSLRLILSDTSAGPKRSQTRLRLAAKCSAGLPCHAHAHILPIRPSAHRSGGPLLQYTKLYYDYDTISYNIIPAQLRPRGHPAAGAHRAGAGCSGGAQSSSDQPAADQS